MLAAFAGCISILGFGYPLAGAWAAYFAHYTLYIASASWSSLVISIDTTYTMMNIATNAPIGRPRISFRFISKRG